MREVDWRSCHSMSENIEIEALERWCKEKECKDMLLIEIGSFKGKMTACLAQFGDVIAVDLFGNIEDGFSKPQEIGQNTFQEFIGNMIRLGLIDRVYPVVSSSRFFKLFEFPNNLEADIVLIDAGHFYTQVAQDFMYVESQLVTRGLMIFHDYKRPGWGYPPYDRSGKRDPWAGVAKFVDELLAKGEWRIYEHFKGIIALERVLP